MRLTNQAILILILCISAALRFYHFTEIPFMHDEFSAVFRTEYNTFSELIENGIKPDGHPAGIQVFIYYWIIIFGETEWLIKLPFAVMGVLSVSLIYLVGRLWYNETVALVCASFITTLQYTIMYSQIARPYISGFFFSLAMIYFWSRLILSPSYKFKRNAIFYVISSALCAYNHHFSLLFAAIVGFSGLAFIRREYLLPYILCGLLIFILYIPHLGIFQAQLHTGGVGGWLAKPEKTFFIEYLYYIFNYSLLSVFTAVALFLTGLFYFRKSAFNWPREILFTVWFILPLIIGYWYSVQYNPVLQYSVLLFSFFPLMFVLFGQIPNQKAGVNLVLAAIILSVNIYSLITERQHYRIFYASPYENIVTDFVEVSQRYSKLIPVIDSHKKITNYYIQKYQADSAFTWFDSFNNEADFIRFLKDCAANSDYLYLGALSSNKPNTVPIIRRYFPEVVKQQNYYGGTTWLFKKNGTAKQNHITVLTFSTPAPEGWNPVNNEKIISSDGAGDDYSYSLDSLTEWSPAFSVPLSELLSHQNNFIDVATDAKATDDITETLLIATLEKNGEVLYFSGTDFKSFTDSTASPNEWFTVNHTMKLADINLSYSNLWLKVFVWNKGKDNLLIDNITINIREGNPLIYSLYEKIP